MPLALVIQHADYESLAGFRTPLVARGYAIKTISVLAPEFDLLNFLEPDLLIIMGGPMGVYEQAQHPWMAHEIIRVAERIVADRPTLGVCLGSQLIAAAMGGRVFKGADNEVGFKPVTLTEAGKRSPLNWLSGQPLLHWHGDTFELPADVTLLASTDVYPHQAFARSANILALQFHPEMGEDDSFDTWCERGDPFIAKAGTDVDRLMAEHREFGPAAVAAGCEMLDHWLAGLPT